MITYFEQQEKKNESATNLLMNVGDGHHWVLLIDAWMINKKIKCWVINQKWLVRVFIDLTGQISNLEDVIWAVMQGRE